MDLFKQLFTDLNTTDSLLFLLFLFLSFLIGLITGRLSFRGPLKRLRKKQQQQEAELLALQTERTALAEQVKVQETALQAAEESTQQTEIQLQSARQSIQEHEVLGQKYRDNINQWESSWTEMETREQAHLLRITELEQTLEEVKNQKPDTASRVPIANERLVALEEKMERLEVAQENWRNNLYAESATTDGRPTDFDFQEWQSLKERLLQVEQDNENLRSTIQSLQGEEEIDVELDLSFYSQQAKVDEAKARLKALFGQKVVWADASQKDNLQSIEGIGPFIEKQLYDIGIYTFQQISQFDAEIIELVTEAIQFFPGRIAKDQWKEQAASRLN